MAKGYSKGKKASSEGKLASGKGTNFKDLNKKMWAAPEMQMPPTESDAINQRKRLAGIS